METVRRQSSVGQDVGQSVDVWWNSADQDI